MEGMCRLNTPPTAATKRTLMCLHMFSFSPAHKSGCLCFRPVRSVKLFIYSLQVHALVARVPGCVFKALLISQVHFCCLLLFGSCWHRTLPKQMRDIISTRSTQLERLENSTFLSLHACCNTQATLCRLTDSLQWGCVGAADVYSEIIITWPEVSRGPRQLKDPFCP